MKAILNLQDMMIERAKSLMEKNPTTFRLKLLKAYNTWQEMERDYADYIADLSDKDDLVDCIKGGMMAGEIAELYNKVVSHEATPYFFFGMNRETPEQIKTYEELDKMLVYYLEEFMVYVIAYPQSYEEFYGELVTDYMNEKRLI